MSSTSRRTVYVGLFVIIAVVIFGGAIFAVGTLQNSFTPKITVSTVFDEVGGLQAGDMVWSAGVRVGVIKELTFIGPGQVEVTMKLDTAMVPFIPADSVATIGSDGLIGNPVVVLSEGTPGGDPIQDGDTVEIGNTVWTSEILTTLQVNNTNLEAITGDIKVITAQLTSGEGTIGRLLMEDDLLDDVEVALADIKAASKSAKELTASLTRFSGQLNQPGQLPYELVHDEEIMPAVRSAIAGLESTVAKAQELVDELEEDLGNEASPVGVLLGDAESGSSLKETLTNLEETTVLLNEDLVAIRSNFLFKPYFKKQEKQAKKEAKQAAREAK